MFWEIVEHSGLQTPRFLQSCDAFVPLRGSQSYQSYSASARAAHWICIRRGEMWRRRASGVGTSTCCIFSVARRADSGSILSPGDIGAMPAMR